MPRTTNSGSALRRPDTRQSPRRRVPLEAQIIAGSDRVFSAQVQNISASGVLLQGKDIALGIGATVEFVLHWPGKVRPLELRILATVIRLEHDGVALRFGRYGSVVYTDLIEVIYGNDHEVRGA